MLSRPKQAPKDVRPPAPVADIPSDNTKKNKSRPKRKKSKQSGSAKDKSSPIVKIPTSKSEASTNWKRLLSNKSSEIAAKKGTKERPNQPTFFLRQDVVKHKKQLMEKKSEDSIKKISNENPELSETIQSTANLRLTPRNETTPTTAAEKKEKDIPKKAVDTGYPIPPLKSLNVLGCFDYTHYGHLKTPMGPEHEFLKEPTPALAIDCEMVGVGPLKEDALARVSIVNEFGYCLYDKFVKPKSEVTDYRTEFSGVREEDLKKAELFAVVMQEVADLIKGQVLVGHSLKSDFDVLFLKHPKAKIRDTAFYYRKRFKKLRTPSLKGLVKDFLKVDIQKGEHNSITDAQAAMRMYLFIRDEWETSFGQKYNTRVNKYWLGRDFRRGFQCLGWNIKKK